MTELKYNDMKIKSFKGNPLIEAVGWGYGEDEFNALCDKPFDGIEGLSGIPKNRQQFALRCAIGSLKQTYVVRDEGFAIYEKILDMILEGYKHRNPLKEGYEKMLTAIRRDMEDPLAAKHIKVAMGNNIEEMMAGNSSYLFAGLSGEGKTLQILKALKNIKKTLKHTLYNDSNGVKHKFEFTQQVYVYIQLNTRKGQKALLKSILASLDEDTGENYSFIYRNADVEELIIGVRKAMIIHGVGILVIDEAQNFSKPPKEMKVGANEKTSIRFVEEIFNRIGVPIFLVGTLSTLNLFGDDVKTIRRVMSKGSLRLYGSVLDSSFWSRFSKEMFQTAFLKNQTTDYETFKIHLHERTQGVTAIASALVIATLQYLTKLDAEYQDLGIESLDLVFERQFKLLKAPLLALKKEEYHKYEDYHVLAILEETDKEEVVYEKDKSEASGIVSPDSAPQKSKAPKKRSTKSNGSKHLKNTPEIDVETAKKMGVNQMMAMVGVDK
jgi:Cdc6-like AAA superfamily ATPase